jgi:UDP-N-acetyl-D-mannosaminuronic acid transferase (WecB/TagA/CpsF family)
MAAPQLNILLQSSGYLSLAEEESLKVEILKRKPKVILIGMGQPRQEEWAVAIRALSPNSVVCCVGGLFDYLAGRREVADFARRFGLEWAFRLCSSPKKTARRYLFGIPALFGYIIMEQARQTTRFVFRDSRLFWPEIRRKRGPIEERLEITEHPQTALEKLLKKKPR